MRAIDADRLLTDRMKEHYYHLPNGDIAIPIIDIEHAPTIHPERKRGRWILHESPDGGEQYECSECGVLWEFNDGTPEDNEAYFCPKCGAEMMEDEV